MTKPEQGFRADLARELTQLTATEEGSGPREISGAQAETPPEETLSDEERHAQIEKHIDATVTFLEQSLGAAKEAHKKVMEHIQKNDIYSAGFRNAWDAMVAQQPYLASLETYASTAVRNAGGTPAAEQRMEAVRQKIADAKLWLDETTKETGKMMIDGGFSSRYEMEKIRTEKPRQPVEIAVPTESKWASGTVRVEPKKKSWWTRLFSRG